MRPTRPRLPFLSAVLTVSVLSSQLPARAQDLAEIESQAIEAFQAGRNDQAIELARQGVDLSRARGYQQGVASFSMRLGMSLSIRNRYREAEAVLREAVALAERGFGPGELLESHALSDLGTAVEVQGRYAEAERFYRRSLAIRERLQPPRPGHVSSAHAKIAGALVKQGKFSEAEASYRKALDVRERHAGPNEPALINTLVEFADFLKQIDRTGEAEALYTRALAIAGAAPETGRSQFGMVPLVVAAQIGLASLQVEARRLDEAEALLRRALALLLRTVGPENHEVAAVHDSLGRIARDRGRYAEAEREFKQALVFLEGALGGDNPAVGTTLHKLAGLEMDQDRYAAAEPLLRRALAVKEKAHGAGHPEAALVAADLARCCRALGRLDEAERLYTRALDAQEKSLGEGHSAVGTTLYLLANFRKEQGRNDEARRLYRRSLAIAEKTAGADSTMALYVRYMMAVLVANEGRRDEARDLLDRVIAGYEKTQESPSYLSAALSVRATVLWNLQKSEPALADLRRAIDLSEVGRAEFTGAERERAGAFAASVSALELMIRMQFDIGTEKYDPGAVFDAMERAHARTLLDEMGMAGTDLDAGRPPGERARLRDREAGLKADVRRLEQKLGQLGGRDDPAGRPLVAELAAARTALYDFDRDRRSTSPTYRALLSRGTKLPTLTEIQNSLLRPGDLMLVYFFGDQIGAKLEVTRDSAKLRTMGYDAREAKVLGVDEGPLTADRLRRSLVNDKGTGLIQRLADPRAKVPAEALAVLADTIIPSDKRKGLADGSIKRLIVIPDGPLAMLPFEALVTEAGDDPRFLLDAGPPVLYAPSAAVLKSLTERPPADPVAGREPVLALGDPAYPAGGADPAAASRGTPTSRSRWATAGGTLPRLPYSGWEARWVAKAFNDQAVPAVTLSGTTATEAGVRYWAPGRRVLHLACHGLADKDLGNFFGALALTPGPAADDPADDGFLNLNEIHALDLSRCELAILSACETNLGPRQKGEGTWALSRGFLVARARRVVASNWLVDDEAAANLMSIYSSLLAGAAKDGKQADYASSLRDAKRWVRTQEKWKAPYYWASLVLVGPS